MTRWPGLRDAQQARLIREHAPFRKQSASVNLSNL